MYSTNQVEDKPDVTYADVGGCKEQIQKLREVVEMPLLHVGHVLLHNFSKFLNTRSTPPALVSPLFPVSLAAYFLVYVYPLRSPFSVCLFKEKMQIICLFSFVFANLKRNITTAM